MQSMRWIWGYIRNYRVRLFIGLSLALAVSVLNMFNPYIAGKIIDKVIYGHQNDLLWPLLGLMIGVTITKTVIRYSYQLMFERISQNVIFTIREELYTRLNQLDFSFYDRTKTGDVMARMTGDLEAVRHFTAWAIYIIFENVTILLFAIGFMFALHPPLALVMLAVTPIIGFFAFRLTYTVKPTFSAIREQFARLNSVVQENISGNRVVKAFAKEDYEIEKFSLENTGFKEKNLNSARVWEKYLPVLDSLAGMLTVVMIVVGGIMVINNSISLGELVTFNSLIWALNNPMRMAGWLINDVQRFIASAEKVEELLNEEPKITNAVNKKNVENFKGIVDFKQVSFSYGEESVLKDITFKGMPGQTIGIIGPTGAGKSTLVNLLSRFYDTDSGEVSVDGINVMEWDIHKLRESMAMVMQDIFLFSDTIEGNIAYGNPEASIESVQTAAKMAEAHNFIIELPDSYETIIGERGVGLSGGQRQRIALARAILKDPSILILDDTTSSVDMETELRIQKTLKSIHQDKTCFIIAHRITSVKEADLILVMENGRIIERGKHEELLKKKGYYANVFKNQYGNFEEQHHGKEVIYINGTK
ncbi:ABC transporter ATP-binding protein [Bacillus sp. ISL-40]|uniref:ABC transporter ATP-binding protein n=1 Tax=unclassified Bacillus (in: firmicutes) TaxID=185979 RepID=UPI001BEB46B8|nr:MULTISPECIES: ABC transporter ATP-binding protein [unclassified Bacillus (in: firmicutes)]MBT2697449.1 ABC transporter ATP-binding protein [Bacillus sp. ISL-40]MBT2721001.1 ABC transporter ATP-binding protein [Bacillus sp. ISL-46]MBT2741735.1 ABC transporter ATP-binding protein [Bacillus sp. ISL-77]